MLTTTVKLPGAASHDSNMEINTSTANKDISLTKEFKDHFPDPTQAHGLLDHGKDRKCAGKCKWTERDYHVQDSKYVIHT